MKNATFVIATSILTQTTLLIMKPVPVGAASQAASKSRTTSKARIKPSKTGPKATSKTSPRTVPKGLPKTTPRPTAQPPAAPDPLAHLTPYQNGFGVMICEPVAIGVEEEPARWGAGATRWLDFVVGSQGELGRNPALNDELLVAQDLKRPDLRLTDTDAAQIARILGLTHAVTSKISGQGEQLVLSLQLLKLEKNKAAAPLGDVISLNGSRETIMAALPGAARQIAALLGVKQPRVPEKLDLSPAELTLLGSVPLNSWEPLDDVKQAELVKLAERETLAALLALRKKDIPQMARLIMRRAPDNIRALVVLSRQGGNQMETFSSEWEPVLKQYPQNYQVIYTQLMQAHWNHDHKVGHQAAEKLVRAAPDSSIAWYRLGQVISDTASNVRQGRVIGAMTETELNTVMRAYPLWQAANERAVRLNPLDGDSWLALARAATFNGDPVADKALWTAQKLMPDSVGVYGWGIQMYQPKWGGDPEQMLKLAEVMTANTKMGKELGSYIATALNYVDFKNPRARKVMQVYLSRGLQTTGTTPALLEAWKALQQGPDDVSRWLNVARESSDAANKMRMGRYSTELSKAEADILNHFYHLWLIAINYGLQLNPRSSSLWVEHSRASSFSGHHTMVEPLDAVEQAILLDPQNRDAYQWGLQLVQPKWRGDPETLWEFVQKAAKPALFDTLAPDIAEALNTLREKTAEQSALLQKALTQIDGLEKRDEAKIQKRLGSYFHATRQYPRALTAFKNWVRLEPGNAEAHFRYGGILQNMAKYDEALAEYREALRLEPDYPQALLYAGGILTYQRKFHEAEPLLRHATEVLPQWAKAYVDWGEALNGMGQRGAARAVWQSAVNLGSQYESRNADVENAKQLLDKYPPTE